MKQLSMFEKLPPNILLSEWMKEHIKTPPPANVTEDQRLKARERLEQMKQLKISKLNLS